jgi:hypothetical protein
MHRLHPDLPEMRLRLLDNGCDLRQTERTSLRADSIQHRLINRPENQAFILKLQLGLLR